MRSACLVILIYYLISSSRHRRFLVELFQVGVDNFAKRFLSICHKSVSVHDGAEKEIGTLRQEVFNIGGLRSQHHGVVGSDGVRVAFDSQILELYRMKNRRLCPHGEEKLSRDWRVC